MDEKGHRAWLPSSFYAIVVITEAYFLGTEVDQVRFLAVAQGVGIMPTLKTSPGLRCRIENLYTVL